MIYNINFEDNKRLPLLPGLSQYQLNRTTNNKLSKVMCLLLNKILVFRTFLLSN